MSVLPLTGTPSADVVAPRPAAPARPGRRDALRSAVRLAVAPLALGIALSPMWWVGYRDWPRDGALGGLVVLPLLAAIVGWYALRRRPSGPPIHDRQLDLIITVLAFLAGAELLHLGLRGSAGNFFLAGAASLMAVAIVAAGWGTRALWQLRWPVALLALTWHQPWRALIDLIGPDARSAAVTVGAALSSAEPAAVPGGRVLTVPSGAGSAVLDPAAGGSVLLFVVVGTLAGLAVAACQQRWGPQTAAVLAGPVVGLALAAAVWLLTVHRAVASGPGITLAWSSGRIQGGALLVVAGIAAAVLAVRGRGRTGDAPGHRAAERLRVAVPRLGRPTALIATLGLAFVLLQLGTGPSVQERPPGAAADGSTDPAGGPR